MSRKYRARSKQFIMPALLAVFITITGIQAFTKVAAAETRNALPGPQPPMVHKAIAYQNTGQTAVPDVSIQLVQAAPADRDDLIQPPLPPHRTFHGNDYYNAPHAWQFRDRQPRGDSRRPARRKESEWQSLDRLSRELDAESRRMHREIERMLDRIYRHSYDRYYRPQPGFRYSVHQDLSAPKMKIREDSTQYIITVMLPGADENDVSVSLDGQRLTIKSKAKSQKVTRDSTGNVVFRAQGTGSYQRSLTLPEPVVKNAMKSKVDNGLLTIIVPKDKEPS